jgi:hypothetical protein
VLWQQPALWLGWLYAVVNIIMTALLQPHREVVSRQLHAHLVTRAVVEARLKGGNADDHTCDPSMMLNQAGVLPVLLLLLCPAVAGMATPATMAASSRVRGWGCPCRACMPTSWAAALSGRQRHGSDTQQ